MFRFVVARFFQSLIALFVVVTLTFFLVRFVPGGPFTQEKAVSPEILRNLEAHYGLDQPLWRQYLTYIGHVARGDLGPSFKYANRTVNEVIGEKLPVALQLGGISLAIALLMGIGLGTMAALRPNTWIDYLASAIGVVGISIPSFVIGPLLVLALAIHVGWFHASGWNDPSDYVLPCLVLGFSYAAPISRLARGGIVDILGQDFIRTARAKGASELRVVMRHALRGGLLPVVSYLGPASAGILTGAFAIETIFQVPGLGRDFITSATNRDYTLVLGTVILYASLLMFMNFVTDVIAAWMNPKVKLEA